MTQSDASTEHPSSVRPEQSPISARGGRLGSCAPRRAKGRVAEAWDLDSEQPQLIIRQRISPTLNGAGGCLGVVSSPGRLCCCSTYCAAKLTVRTCFREAKCLRGQERCNPMSIVAITMLWFACAAT